MNGLARPARKNYPRNIALIKPQGNKITEFLIICKNEIGALASIAAIFAKQNVNIEIAYGHADHADNRYLLVLYADFSNSPVLVEQVVTELRALFVTHNVEIDADQTKQFDDFLFPILGFQQDRAVVMGLNALIKLEQNMFEKIGSGAHAFLFQMGKDYSTENSKVLRSSNFQQDQESQLRNLIDSMKAAGWGRFHIKQLSDGFDVVITDLQLLDGHTFVDTRFMYGMLAVLLQSIFGEEFYVIETRYDTRENLVFLKLRIKKKKNQPFEGET